MVAKPSLAKPNIAVDSSDWNGSPSAVPVDFNRIQLRYDNLATMLTLLS